MATHTNRNTKLHMQVANSAAFVVCVCVVSELATAASPEPTRPNRALEEIVVTAQRRQERLQDVPMTIAVLDSELLDQSTVQGLTDSLNRVPGVTMFDGGRTTITVRGVSAAGSSFSGSSPTGYYLDSTPFGFVKSAMVPDATVFDLDRVEVLKGPQGTLYGANSISGVVRILTNDPNMDELEAKGMASLSSTKGGGDGYRGDMAVNVPIVTGKLAVRAVAGYNHIGGWIDGPAGKDLNDSDVGNFRMKVAAKPTDDFSVLASVWSSRRDNNAPPTSDRFDRRLRTLDESSMEDFDAYGLQLDYAFPIVTLSSRTSYIDYRRRDSSDLGDAFGLGEPIGLISTFKSHVFAEELLASYDEGGAWLWSLGGFYRDAKDPQDQDFVPEGLVPALVWFDSSRSFATFGQVTRRLFDKKIEVTAGLRYFRDRVEQQEYIHFPDPTLPVDATSKKFDATTPRFAVSWRPSDDLSLYASYSRGFRSGFEQDVIVQASRPGLPPANPDKLTNYEIGAKGSAWGNLLGYDLAVYYLDWNDVQQGVQVPFAEDTYALAITNAGSASGFGFDAAINAHLTDSLEVAAGFSMNDLTFDRDIYSGGSVLFAKGSRLRHSPEYTASLSAAYKFSLGRSGYTGAFSTSANYTSANGSNVLLGTEAQPPEGDEILLARASIVLSSPSDWELSLFSENITDRRSTIEYGSSGDPDDLRRLPPRRIGLQVEYRFGGQ
ncbi:TonB-dependent receptor [Peristeroidobacter agariperforans]|uniref:TonB-dependent receptor n=1 Tax=Peristeroidobacter agariperforans TaxID=268404 RepID=UPI00101B6873|nr:TonB-dependent receptor [Peristeroidobacter agariperforans]